MVIDHVTIAWSALNVIRQVFSRVGLETVYGGEHSNHITHMAILGFDDGSYIELISTLNPGEKSPWWSRHILKDGGASAWAVRVDDINEEVNRVKKAGIPAECPRYYNRKRPDGIMVEWDLSFLGEKEPGAQLPFLIADRTPRSFRVQPSASVTGSELAGVKKVILGVNDLETTSSLFRSLYGWKETEEIETTGLDARLAGFKDQPVILAEPSGESSWLAERLKRFGESPCGYLIGSQDLSRSRRNGYLGMPETWFGQKLAWFEPMISIGLYLGVIEV